ncbi:hypothetical protein KDA_54470 [Dictyobacter alpinus]|uniref:Uncharacterized protein n=1 Tax=Dictyobacter alpinus TaxID=2014873 RepID=A0A402BF07_9CHLR|nr:nuclear transport factor 2 family protein [Dictyobacter alpinus]GCE29963.1 hypothetical protein KDA_54470 [Dictyobacter alpinus]
MNQQHITEFTPLVERYMTLWNEPDENVRRNLITDLWTEDGAQFTSLREIRGHQALMERVSSAYDKFVKTEGFLFKVSSPIETRHDAIKFHWEMIPATGGEAASVGTVFLLLSNDGRIHYDYQF